MTEINEHQAVTRYIKNWADNAKFQVHSSHLTMCGLTVNRSEMPNFSYTHPLGASRSAKIKLWQYLIRQEKSFGLNLEIDALSVKRNSFLIKRKLKI